MIKSFRHKGLRSLFESGKAAGEFEDGHAYILDYEDYH
jgi:plasmid maintenance system killer protein